MTIPLEDKMVHRGYAVFETTKIFGNKIYQLDKHLDRLNKSIKKINLNSMYSTEQYRDILMRLAIIARKIEPKSDIELRFFYSAGLGNMSLVVNNNLNSFYAIALRTDYSLRPVEGVEERLIFLDPIKKDISSSKNTNYLLNALVSKYSREQGGYLGIMVDEEGNLLESPISNIAFVLKNGDFNVPPFDKTLVGTTVLRLFDFVRDVLIPNGEVKNINRDYVNINNYTDIINEAMFVGGDFVIPILKINGQVVTDEPGPITKKLQQFLINDKQTEEVADEIPDIDIDIFA
jgi:branched-subunit amino acid aminotransferase/4-amino-4-deoxychorismate lyase